MVNWVRTKLIPRSLPGRILLIGSIVISFSIYSIKLILNETNPIPLGFICLPILCVIGILVFSYFLGTIAFIFIPEGHYSPMATLIVGVIIALFFPTPPTYEIRLFKCHRSNFELLVDEARQQKLTHDQKCRLERSYAIPTEFKKLSEKCIYVDYQPYFSVEFRPRTYMQTIIYTENPEQIHDLIGCNPDAGDLVKPLDKNWFFCSASP
jgi:hypothetical protein